MQKQQRVRLEKRAKRDLAALPVVDSTRILHCVKRYAESGHGDVRHLRGDYEGELRLRVGRYRIILSIRGRYVIVHAIVDRKDAYR